MPDAVLVLGGGLREEGRLPSWVSARFDRAIDLASGAPIIALSAGTPHKPIPAVYESAAGARYLLSKGYPPNNVLYETASWDTIGNAFMARTIHTDPAGFRDLIVVTSDFHMPRTEAIFRWIFGASPPTPAYRLSFESTTTTGMPAEALNARLFRERDSLEKLRENIARLTTLSAIHAWLFSEHEVYAAHLTPKKCADPQSLRSY